MRRSRRPIRLSSTVIVLVLLAGLGGFLFLQSTRMPVKVYVAARDLPAFHQIEPLDVRQAEVPGDRVPEYAVRNRDSLLGRYTLAPLRQDKPFDAKPGRLARVLAMGVTRRTRPRWAHLRRSPSGTQR